jgi:protocatechuate 3,4-dioxygenase beta subunit
MTTAPYYQRNRGLHPPAHAPDYKSSVARSPRLAPVSFGNTLSEITGPVFTPGRHSARRCRSVDEFRH